MPPQESPCHPLGVSLYRVLVVEDNPHVSEIFRYAFRRIVRERLGKEVEVRVDEASDGRQAWEMLGDAQLGPYDLVVLDLMLPVLEGGELLSRLRGDPRFAEVPVVVITAADPDSCEDARASGATVVLRKPVQFNQIRDVVAEILPGE